MYQLFSFLIVGDRGTSVLREVGSLFPTMMWVPENKLWELGFPDRQFYLLNIISRTQVLLLESKLSQMCWLATPLSSRGGGSRQMSSEFQASLGLSIQTS